MSDTVLYIAALAGAATTIYGFLKWVLPAIRKVSRVIDEIVGEPAEFGREAKPGIVQKLDTLTTKTDTLQLSVARIEHEVFPNSSLSLRDAVNRTEAGQKRTEKKLDDHIAAQGKAVSDLSEAMPIVAGSTPPAT